MSKPFKQKQTRSMGCAPNCACCSTSQQPQNLISTFPSSDPTAPDTLTTAPGPTWQENIQTLNSLPESHWPLPKLWDLDTWMPAPFKRANQWRGRGYSPFPNATTVRPRNALSSAIADWEDEGTRVSESYRTPRYITSQATASSPTATITNDQAQALSNPQFVPSTPDSNTAVDASGGVSLAQTTVNSTPISISSTPMMSTADNDITASGGVSLANSMGSASPVYQPIDILNTATQLTSTVAGAVGISPGTATTAQNTIAALSPTVGGVVGSVLGASGPVVANPWLSPVFLGLCLVAVLVPWSK